MIHIRVERDVENQINRILVQGHAGFDRYGHDIVCAAVSSVAIGLTNAIEVMCNVRIHADDDGDGKVDCTFPQDITLEQAGKIRLLMEAMYLSLQGISEEFPNHVRIDEQTGEE